jgi:hypothetical protein
MTGAMTNTENLNTNRTVNTRQQPPRTPAGESTITIASVDRISLERWEGEGGRALTLEELRAMRRFGG